MERSWTSPILQAMQQHRGSQEHKPALARPAEAVRAATDAAKADATSPSQVAAGNENSNKV